MRRADASAAGIVVLASSLVIASAVFASPGRTAPAAALPAAATSTARQDLDVALAAGLHGCQLTAIELHGLGRTDPIVVHRELVIAIGRPLRPHALRESTRRLRNLGIFRRVDVDVVALDAMAPVRRCRVAFVLDERWTLLPIFSAGGGGGLAYLSAGLQDIHLGGRYQQLEAFWQVLGGVHSGAVVFTEPRLRHRRLALTLSAGLWRRNRDRFAADGAILPGYARERWQLGAELHDLRDPDRTWRVALWWMDDAFGVRTIEPSARAGALALGLPPARRWLALGLGGRLGRVDLDDYLERGAWIDAAFLAGIEAQGRDAPWLRVQASAKAAWLPWRRLNLAVRVHLAAIDRRVAEVGLYAGGLDGLRALPDSRFHGRVLALASAEARLPSLHARWLALQHVLFVDAGRAAADGAGLLAGGLPVSAGTGVRLLVPKVARLVARLDLGWAVGPGPAPGAGRRPVVSFGAQQAF